MSKNIKPSTSLKFITWNVNGLDENDIWLRTKAVCKYIKKEEADIVFLQEVVLETAEYFVKLMEDYVCLFGNKGGRFVGILLKKSTVKYDEGEVIYFPNTRMMRSVFEVKATFQNIPLCLFNLHLESFDKYSDERKKQLGYVFKKVLATPEDVTVIFGGNLNLTDAELRELGGLPTGIKDIFRICGSPEGCYYTFDTTRNDNLLCRNRSNFIARKRNDRVYIRASSPSHLQPVFFDLIGLERLKYFNCFPSDHWGILAYFEMVK